MIEVKKKLIINADDYGLSRCYNRGIIKAFAARRLTATSVLVTHKHWRDKRILKQTRELGLHLDFKFFEGEDYKKEILRQYDLFVDYFGFKPDHLDGHYHAHLNEKIIDAVIKIALRLSLPVRSYDEISRGLFREKGVKTTDNFIDSWLLLKDNFEIGLPKVIERLNNLPAGTSELMVHPGFTDPARPSSYNQERELELGFLLSQDFGDILKNNQIKLIGWRGEEAPFNKGPLRPRREARG